MTSRVTSHSFIEGNARYRSSGRTDCRAPHDADRQSPEVHDRSGAVSCPMECRVSGSEPADVEPHLAYRNTGFHEGNPRTHQNEVCTYQAPRSTRLLPLRTCLSCPAPSTSGQRHCSPTRGRRFSRTTKLHNARSASGSDTPGIVCMLSTTSRPRRRRWNVMTAMGFSGSPRATAASPSTGITSRSRSQAHAGSRSSHVGKNACSPSCLCRSARWIWCFT